MKKIASQIDDLQKSFCVKSDLFKIHQKVCHIMVDSYGFQNFKLKDFEVVEFQSLRNMLLKEISRLISKIDSIKIPNKLKGMYYYLLDDLEKNLEKIKSLLNNLKNLFPADCKQNIKEYLKLFDELKIVFDSKFDLKQVMLSNETKPLSYLVENLNRVAA